ncbi:MAG: isochorismatase family protein [Alphaproteobacteria bacterium]
MSETLLIELQQAMPLVMEPLDLTGTVLTGVDLPEGSGKTGLIIVDIVNGFATVGAANLAPAGLNAQVSRMVAEPPYPPHCEIGTGEENLVPELLWLEDEPGATLVRKDCINGFIGAYRADGSNALLDWLNREQIGAVLAVGICTDICVMDMVLTLLSARNHDMAPSLRDIHVYDQGCATFDLPRALAEELDLGIAAAHPQDATHHMGLYFMAARGAHLVDKVEI